jgi:hypothetical protein
VLLVVVMVGFVVSGECGGYDSHHPHREKASFCSGWFAALRYDRGMSARLSHGTVRVTAKAGYEGCIQGNDTRHVAWNG